MSFVCYYSTKEYALMVSDGRLVNRHTGEVVSEGIRKVWKIGNKVLLGSAGNATFTKFVIRYIADHFSESEVSIDEISDCISTFASLVNEKVHNYDDSTASFIIAEVGVAKMIHVSNGNVTQQTIEVHDEPIIESIGIPCTDDMRKMIELSISENGIISGLSIVLSVLSRMTPTVNDNLRYEVLCLDQGCESIRHICQNR